jgi:hypothetical protein
MEKEILGDPVLRSLRRVVCLRNPGAGDPVSSRMMAKFLLWCILLVFCWPLALLALFLYPIVWLLLIPFQLVGITIGGVLAFLKALLFLPARILAGPGRV